MNESVKKLKTGVLDISPITGTLGFNRAKHLANRALFGARLSEIRFLADKTIDEALDFLLQDPISPLSPPLGAKDSDLEIPVGTTWVNTPYNYKYRSQRIYSYNCWWIGRLIHQDLSLKEKMTLFWHNHFVIENDVVKNTNFNFKYNELIFRASLGNFKTLTEEMTVNVGMLNYLDGVDNEAGAPNENYARELFELFTVGKGPLIEEGNYTNYTEHDIREAAKVLTGWKTNSNTNTSYFNSSKHDKSIKTFSEIFENHSITNNEEHEYKDLISMIFQKKETARFLIRKIYRWFVYYIIDENIEAEIIEPLATLFVQSDFELKPVLKKLLSSNHFFDENYRGCMIKNPLELNIGILRQLEFKVPDNTNIEIQYGFWNLVRYHTSTQDMELGNPPDVAGWPAWYLEPLYNELWINTATIPNKATLIKTAILWGIRPGSGMDKIYYDPFALAYLVNNPGDINELIETITSLLFPVAISNEQKNELKETLIPGLPDFEWTAEWNKYINNPDDENQKNAVKNSLNNLLTKMCLMAEYQIM